MKIEHIYPIEQARKEIHLKWPHNHADAAKNLDKLQQLLSEFKGGNTLVTIDYSAEKTRAKVQLGEAWRVNAKDELLHHLRVWFGQSAVRITY